jgi:lipase
MNTTDVQEIHRHTAIGPGYRQTKVAVRGGDMTVGIWGPSDPAAPTILAVHGVSASHRSFGLLAEAMPDVRIIAPDLRGRGRSNGLPGPYGMPAHADDLSAVLTALADGPLTVVGHSMGAFVTLVLADRHPDQVDAVVLVDGGIPLKVPEGLAPEVIVQAVLGPVADRLAMRFDSVEAYRSFWLEHPALGFAWSPGAPEGLRPLMDDYIAYDLEQDGNLFRPATRYEAMKDDTVELQGGGSLQSALEHLAVPATLLWTRRGLFNEEPGLFTAEDLERWQDTVPALKKHLTCVEVPETNHYTILMASPGAVVVSEAVRGIHP